MIINFLPFDFLIHYVFSLPKRIVFPHDRLPTLRVPPLRVSRDDSPQVNSRPAIL